MPRKIRELEADLAKAGFKKRPGKGSHRVWEHPKVRDGVTIAGKPCNDAKPYQERDVRNAIKEASQ
jgi:predicted RNA binding protein YcfA (HicA-like mRNA interferase family)